jgi:hypothetical protein
MRLVDIPAHILFLAAEHRFLCFAIPIALAIFYRRAPVAKSHVLAWLLVWLNIFFGTYLASYVLYKIGEPAPAQITAAFNTANIYNNRPVVRYNVQIKIADGKIIETSFEDEGKRAD